MPSHPATQVDRARTLRLLVEQSAGLVPTPAVEPSPHLESAERQVVAWAVEHELVGGTRRARFAAIRCGSCAAHTYPRASRTLVELGADLIGWLFLFDDAYGERADGLPGLERDLQTFEPLLFDGVLPDAPSPYHRALADLRARIVGLSEERFAVRFAYSMRRYFDGCLLEFPYRTTGRSPSLSVYRSLRRWSIGVQPVLDSVELGLPRPLDTEMGKKEALWVLRNRAATLCAWANDLYSFDKERRDRDPLNLVSVLLRERGLGVELALADAVRLYNADLAAFDAACLAFLDTGTTSSLETSYVRGVRDWVFGNHQWTRQSRRYA